MKTNLSCLIIILLFAFLSACGSPPLVAPEQDVDQEVTSSAQSEQLQTDSRATSVVQSTATPEIVGGSNTSPIIPAPTATPIEAKPPVPAVKPLPTEPNDSLSKQSVMIGNYTFGPPKEIANTRFQDGVEIVDWIPNKSEVLLKTAHTLQTVNISTGDFVVYATVKEPGNIRHSIWLSDTEEVAYFSSDIEKGGQQNLWMGQSNSDTRRLLSDVAPPIIPLQKGVAVYSQAARNIQSFSMDGQKTDTLPENFNHLPSEALEQFEITPRFTAIQPNTNEWVAISRNNIQGLQFVNSETGEMRSVDLGGDTSAPLWALTAQWSPDGQKLALIVTQGATPIQFSDLYILEWPAAELSQITKAPDNVTDITWAPDNSHLLFKAMTEQKDGLDFNNLYLVDVSRPDEILSVPIELGRLSSGYGGTLSWSPDGKTILIRSTNGPGLAIYQVSINL